MFLNSSTVHVVTPVPPVLSPLHNATRYTPGFKQTQKTWLNEIKHPARQMGLWAAYAFLFLRFTDLHLIISAKTGFSNYLLYFTGLPAFFGLLLSGGLRRAFRLRSSWYWLGFMVLMGVASVFSSWMGGSIPFTFVYFRTTWISFLLLAGLIMTWKELWGMLQLIALCAAVNVLIGIYMSKTWQQGGRIGVELGTNSNPNDFAAVLILVLPFLGLVLFTPKRNMLVRVAALAFLLAGFYRVLSTGSRGAVVGIAIGSLYLIAKLPSRLKIMAVLGGLAICLIVVMALPKTTTERLATWNSSSDNEATESSEMRKQLFQKSLLYTVQHPILGVGPDQFGSYEGVHAQAETGRKGLWHATHNSYTQIASENGIPAVICFLMALGSSYRLILHVFQRTRRRKPSPELKKLNMAAFCLLVSMVGFCVTIAFNNFGYLFFVPALVGLAAVLTEVTEHEFHIPLGVSYRSHHDKELMSPLA